MSVTKDDLSGVITKLENNEYTSYFFLPDFEKPSGGMQLTYNHVKCMNENGFNAKIIHQKSGFKPEWLNDYFEKDEDGNLINIPTIYLDDGTLAINMEDFFFVPEGFPQVMENLQKQNAPCKKVVFCQNWYYILNSLHPGVDWTHYGIYDCMSVSNIQSEYIKMIMPAMRIKNVYGHIDNNTFYPPENMLDKKFEIAFIPSRDISPDGSRGMKSYNVIKTFYLMFPQFRFLRFRELSGLKKDEYAKAMRDSTFYIHFDEYSSWGTAPIEAFLSKCLVAGWDGVGGKEYMNNENMFLAPNGDIVGLALAIGRMIEAYMTDDIKDTLWEEAEKATMLYSKESEKDSIIMAHNEYRESRISEINLLIDRIKENDNG